jgi:hypothetical protein
MGQVKTGKGGFEKIFRGFSVERSSETAIGGREGAWKWNAQFCFLMSLKRRVLAGRPKPTSKV